MTLSKEKTDLVLARQQMTAVDVSKKAGFSTQRFYTILNSKNVTPKCVGRVAAALGVDVTEILEN